MIFGDPGGIAVTFHSHSCIVIPLRLEATALTFQRPIEALVLVYADSVTSVWLNTSVPLMYQVTFTVWFEVMLNILVSPCLLLAGEKGA